jgi:hypothetical protein
MTLYEKAIKMYEAIMHECDDEYTFEGSLVALYRSTGLNAKFYSPVTTVLYETGAVEMVQRGTSQRPTILKLHHHPTEEEVERARHVLSPAVRRGKMEDRVTSIEGRLPDINLSNYITALEARLRSIEDRLTSVEVGGTIAETTTNTS